MAIKPPGLVEIVGNDLVFAGLCAGSYLCLYLLAVSSAAQPLRTPFGPEVVGLFPAIGQLYVQTALVWRFGPIVGASVVFTCYAFGLTLHAPGYIGPTTLGKVAATAVLAVLYHYGRHWHPLTAGVVWLGAAMATDTIVFAFSFGHPEVIPASLSVKALFYVAALSLFAARRPKVERR